MTFRTRSTTTRDRNLQFRGGFSTGFSWVFSSGFVSFFSRFSVQLFSKEMAPKRGENCPISGRRKRVESCHFSGCHGFSGPEKWLPGPKGKWLKNDSTFDSFPGKGHVRSHFWVTFPGTWKVIFASSKVSFLGLGSVAQRPFTEGVVISALFKGIPTRTFSVFELTFSTATVFLFFSQDYSCRKWFPRRDFQTSSALRVTRVSHFRVKWQTDIYPVQDWSLNRKSEDGSNIRQQCFRRLATIVGMSLAIFRSLKLNAMEVSHHFGDGSRRFPPPFETRFEIF